MRILGFSRKDLINYSTGRPKLEEDEFTTFRFTRRDRDWEVDELAQVVYKPRRKGGGERLGVAEIISKQGRNILPPDVASHSPLYFEVMVDEARRDGFRSYRDMWDWLYKAHGDRLYQEPMNKLTLHKVGDW